MEPQSSCLRFSILFPISLSEFTMISSIADIFASMVSFPQVDLATAVDTLSTNHQDKIIKEMSLAKSSVSRVFESDDSNFPQCLGFLPLLKSLSNTLVDTSNEIVLVIGHSSLVYLSHRDKKFVVME